MLNPSLWEIVDFPADSQPMLMVLVDTEEEFDWSKPHSPQSNQVTAVRHLSRPHRIFERYGIKPTYLVDYPVITKIDGLLPLREIYQHGLCEIGAHLHPWVNPPFREEVSQFTSYPGNLPCELEHAKLLRLTEAIRIGIGRSPTVYRAGRFGVGHATTRILRTLGYEIDVSVVPETNFQDDFGPDFSACGARPYWFGTPPTLLEIPLTVGFYGGLRKIGQRLYRSATSSVLSALRAPSILARSGLLERIRLSPEGIAYNELKRLTDTMLRERHKVFCFTYHSPSLAPGNTPYVRTDRDLQGFLDKFDRYFEYFFGAVGGRGVTPNEVRGLALRYKLHG